jgi:hypothetical protein
MFHQSFRRAASLFLLAAALCSAQVASRVDGTVRDASDAPMQGVRSRSPM